jgi:hypothetical protein
LCPKTIFYSNLAEIPTDSYSHCKQIVIQIRKPWFFGAGFFIEIDRNMAFAVLRIIFIEALKKILPARKFSFKN